MPDEIAPLKEELESLRVSASTYHQLFVSALDAVFVHDAETGEILDVNQTMLRMFRSTREDALREQPGVFSQGDAPYSGRDAAEWITRAAKEGPQVFDWVARRGDGTTFPAEIGLSQIELGGVQRILAVVRDVSRRHEVEEALLRRTRFETIVAELSTRFVSVSLDDVDTEIEAALRDVASFAGANAGYVLRFTERATRFGLTHLWSDGTLATTLDSVRELPVAAMPWWMNRLLDNQVVAVPSVEELPPEASVERQIIESQGIASLIDVPLAFQGEVVGALGFSSATNHRSWSEVEVLLLRFVGHIFMSAIERKASEAALRESQAQLLQAQKMEAIGRLAGGVAHDFNNLLTAILGYADLVLQELEPNSTEHEDVQEIQRAGKRAAQLTTQLLAFSRKQVSNPRALPVGSALEDSQKLLARILGDDVELEFAAERPFWKIRIDPGQLDQIVVNLATNARDAMPDGGCVRISTHNRPAASSGAPGDCVQIKVSDQGEGIPPDVREKIFEPFYTTKPVNKGTGLGLSTVYGLVKQNGGTVHVESTVGGGSTFTVVFPRQLESEVGPVEAARTETPPGSERILLVEDEVLVRSLTQRLLVKQGYTVVAAPDGLEACRIVDAGAEFDLLLTDVVMPRLKGPDLYERLLERLPELKCLFMSGYAENVIVHHGVTDPGKRLLQKPFSVAALASGVRSCLDDA